MPGKKIIVGFGTTGPQGGGLARAILSDNNGRFAVRDLPGIPIQIKRKNKRRSVQR